MRNVSEGNTWHRERPQVGLQVDDRVRLPAAAVEMSVYVVRAFVQLRDNVIEQAISRSVAPWRPD